MIYVTLGSVSQLPDFKAPDEGTRTVSTATDQAKVLRAMAKLGTAFIEVTKHCPSCEGWARAGMVPVLGLARWYEGESIQDALPELSAEAREVLLSGYCHVCQAEIFKPEEDM